MGLAGVQLLRYLRVEGSVVSIACTRGVSFSCGKTTSRYDAMFEIECRWGEIARKRS